MNRRGGKSSKQPARLGGRRRRGFAGLSAGRAAISGSAPLALALALAFSSCGDGDKEISLPPPSELDEIRRLNIGEFWLAARPATCERTRVVTIVAGRPRPRERKLTQGDCLMFANPSSDSATVVGSTARARRALRLRPSDVYNRIPAGFASGARGPLDALPRRRAFGASGSAHIPTLYNSEMPSGFERGISAFHPARPRQSPLRCPSRALRIADAKAPLRLSYTIKPGGAKGAVILDRSGGRSKEGARPVPRGLEQVARLACGRLMIAERPVGCKATRSVLIVARNPRPRRLRLPRAGGCVVWGNQDGSEAALKFNTRVAAGDAAINYRRLWPKAAAAWDFFVRSSPGRVSYRVEPGGAQGTILLD